MKETTKRPARFQAVRAAPEGAAHRASAVGLPAVEVGAGSGRAAGCHARGRGPFGSPAGPGPPSEAQAALAPPHVKFGGVRVAPLKRDSNWTHWRTYALVPRDLSEPRIASNVSCPSQVRPSME